jgi:type IV secretion system protein VirD4
VGDVFIRVHSFTHLLTVAPAGGGKTTHTLAPTLLSYAGNCVVVDPKGELFAKTAEHRRKRFKHTIIRLDPALLRGPDAHRFNPFDYIDANSKEFLGLCRDYADMMVARTGREHDQHFNDSASNVIAAFIAYVCACEGDPACRNLEGMRVFLASRANYEAALKLMQDNKEFHGVLSQLGYSLTWHLDRELGSVMSTAQRYTNIFDEPLIAESTSDTNWELSELRSGKMTVYLIVPANKLVVWAGLQRLWIGSILRLVTSGVPTEKNPVLFLVDECAHIGRIQALEDAITLLRGAGVRVWLFFQSLDQLNKCFGDHASTILDNLSTQQYFSIHSYETAEILSKRIGDTTIAIQSQGGSAGSSSPVGASINNPRTRNSGTSFNVSETGRRLLKENEILELPDSVVLVFHRNLPVIAARRIKYFEDKAFRRGGVGRSRGLGLGRGLVALVVLVIAITGSLVAGLVTTSLSGPASPIHSFFNSQPERIFPELEPAAPSPVPSKQPSLQPSRPLTRPYEPPARRGRPSQTWE